MKKILNVLLMVLLLSGCAEKEVLDDISIVRSVGFDTHEKKNHVTGTILYPIFIDEETFKMQSLTVSGETARELGAEFNEMVARPIFLGKLNTVLFSDELAEKGIMETLDTLQRDPGIGRAIYLAVTKGDTKKILTHDFDLTNADGNYFSNMIEQNENFSNLPLLNFHTFLYAVFADCQDPVLPYLSLRNNSVKINGLALFKEDQMVGTLNEQQLISFKTMFQRSREGSYQFSSKNIKGNLEILKSKNHFTIISKPHHKVILNVDIKGRLTEYTKMDAENPKVVKKIEKSIEKELEIEGMKLIGKFKKLNIDPLGIGEHVRSRTKGFNHIEWNDRYQDLEIDVKYNVKITESGISQ